MAITIGSNIAALGAQRRLAQSSGSLTKSFERLSSGLRINRASDDAAGLAIAASLNADARVYAQGIRNLNDGISMLSIAEGGLRELSAITTRQAELAEQAANGVYSVKQRAALDAEARALTSEYNRIVATTSYNNLDLLNRDSATLLALQAGYGSSATLSVALGLASGSGSTSSSNSAASGAADQTTFDFANLQDIAESWTIRVAEDWSGYAGSGAGPYLTFSTLDASGIEHSYYIWVNTTVGGAPTNYDPVPPGTFDYGIEVQLDYQSDQLTSAAAIASSLAGVSYMDVSNNGDGTITVTNQIAGNVTDVYDAGGGLASVQGYQQGQMIAGSALHFSTTSGNYYAFFHNNTYNLGDDGAGPGIQINYDTTDTMPQIRTKAIAAISAALGGQASVTATGTTYAFGLTITNSSSGAVGAPSTSVGEFLGGSIVGSIGMSYTRNVTGVNSAINVVSDTITVANHGYSTAQAVTISTNGALPGGLSAGTYYAIVVDSNTIKLATSAANATGGTAVNLTSVGSGTMTLQSTMAGVSAFVTDIDLTSAANAKSALDTVKDRLNTLSSAAGSIGSYQSRFNSAINTLSTTVANYTDAQSRIRDADVAVEAANLARLSILQQAGAAVLAQAKREPEIALQLLKSI